MRNSISTGRFKPCAKLWTTPIENSPVPGADRHRDALQRLGRVMMDSIAEIIETDGGTDGYLYDADGIAQDIEACYHKLVQAEEAAEPDFNSRQASHGTLNYSQQGVGR